MKGTRFPSSLGELDASLMTDLLSEQHPGVEVANVRVADRAHRGDGSSSTADRVTLDIEYVDGRDAGLPTRMICKAVLLDKRLRFGPSAIRMTGTLLHSLGRLPFGDAARSWTFAAIRAYQKRYPHAPDAMYRNEVRFYREVRPKLEIEAPRAFSSVYDDDARTFGILMEDLSRRSAIFPNATMRQDGDRLRQLLATLAALHSAFWESPRLDTDLRWVATPRSGGMYPVFQALGLDIVRNQLEHNPFKADLIAPLGRSVEELWAALWRLQAHLDSSPRTLLHGDPHIGNTYLLPDGRAGFLDWQLMVKGRWAHDVTYVMVTGLAVEDRRAMEHELLCFYLEELRRHGVLSPPSFDEAWADYRRTVAWGLVIGWLITPPENYGERVTSANIERLVHAAVDLGTFDLIGR
jgi:aminoglycoside phosphotransferase (APT) family kinase protein